MAQALITNRDISLWALSPEKASELKKILSYTDKSKSYQIKKMEKNPYTRNSPFLKKLKAEAHGVLYEEPNPGHLVFSSGFHELLCGWNLDWIQDDRKYTGSDISLPWSKKPYDLRDYQRETVDTLKGKFRAIACLATSLGKTLVATYLVKEVKKKTLIICPTEAIAMQFEEELISAFGANRIGFYSGKKKKIKDITVGIAASVVRNIAAFRAADLGMVIVDEAHTIAATTIYSIARGLGDVGRIYGLTATDFRNDGKDILLIGGCGPSVITRDVVWGIENGWLAKPYFIVREVDTVGHDYRDDKLKSYHEHVLYNKLMKDIILNDAKKFMAAGSSVLILVDEVKHGLELSKDLGIPFAQGDDKESTDYLKDLNHGAIPGLVGTDGKVGMGANTKNVDVLIMASFMASKVGVIQAIGRGLRKQGKKTKCIILDYIPTGSTMMSRHADLRIGFYREITDNVKVI